MPFSTLERKILTAKGLSEEQLAALSEAGVASKDDLRTVGDAATLRELMPDLDGAIADRVMTWALGQAPPAGGITPGPSGKLLLDTADVVYCVHCSAKQPKDYKSGDLCGSCGRQAEPILACFWCSSAPAPTAGVAARASSPPRRWTSPSSSSAMAWPRTKSPSAWKPCRRPTRKSSGGASAAAGVNSQVYTFR